MGFFTSFCFEIFEEKKILANSTKPISIGIVVFVGGAETKFQTYFPDFILGEKNLLGLKQSY